MKPVAIVAVVLAAVGVAVAAPIVSTVTAPAPTNPIVAPTAKPVEPDKADTPMADRLATIGILNKRNGLSRDLTMKPGQAVRIGDLVVRLKACETTADWESDPLTGAFVQVIVHGADDKWRKVFSGWLYKETPSLNVVEHSIYDVWTKACTMRHAEIGPDTVSLTDDGENAGGSSVPRRSNAAKSPAVPVDNGSGSTSPDMAASSNAI